MRFQWIFDKDHSQKIKYFVKELGISKALLAKVKFQGGRIEVNGVERNVLYSLQKNDELIIEIPSEKAHETLLYDETPITIVYEDEHFLVVNKPSGTPSIPSRFSPNGTMANRVKHYVTQRHYENQVIHIVTRLDRDTTGLMLFAKHGFSHALMDRQLRDKKVVKKYQALVSGKLEKLKAFSSIVEPIARDQNSILKREVQEGGKEAHTDYWLEKKNEEVALLNIQLHTGRTHQIRVHFEHLGCPLLGDELYGGDMEKGMKRQALHCAQLQFFHPFFQKNMEFTQDLPEDMECLVRKL